MTERILAELTRVIAERERQSPISNKELRWRFGISEREVKLAVQKLRERGVPIGSSRRAPSGYFWIHTVEEMEAFIQWWRATALSELRTLAKITRINFPELSGQLRLPLAE